MTKKVNFVGDAEDSVTVLVVDLLDTTRSISLTLISSTVKLPKALCEKER